MRVIDAIEACEYSGCDVYDMDENKIEVTEENKEKVYLAHVNYLSAENNRVKIVTYLI